MATACPLDSIPAEQLQNLQSSFVNSFGRGTQLLSSMPESRLNPHESRQEVSYLLGKVGWKDKLTKAESAKLADRLVHAMKGQSLESLMEQGGYLELLPNEEFNVVTKTMGDSVIKNPLKDLSIKVGPEEIKQEPPKSQKAGSHVGDDPDAAGGAEPNTLEEEIQRMITVEEEKERIKRRESRKRKRMRNKANRQIRQHTILENELLEKNRQLYLSEDPMLPAFDDSSED